MWMYKICMIVAIVLVVLSITLKPQKMKFKNFRKASVRSGVLLKADKLISKNKYIRQQKEKYISKLQLILDKGKEQCSIYVTMYFAGSFFAAVFIGIILASILTVWHFTIIISIAILYTLMYCGSLILKIKIDKIYSQFPEALQIFTDEFMEYKNIKKAVDNSYNRMPEQIGKVFEKLSRELSSGGDFRESIEEMANSLEYIWAYTFAEILLMSFNGAGNIEEDLLYLNNLICEEATIEEEVRTEMATNKIIFIILNILTLGMFIINMVTNNLSRYLYFFTSTGSGLIIMWLVLLIGGFTILNISEKV